MGNFPGSILLSGADILTTTLTKIHPLGTRGYTRDGRTFHYTRNAGVALGACVPIQGAVPSAYEVLFNTGTTALKANTSRVSVISSGNSLMTSQNSYADGFLYGITSSTAKNAVGYAQIKSHTTENATATGKVAVDFYPGDALYSPSTNFGTTNCGVAFQRNPYDKVVVKPSGIVTAPIMGVAPRVVGVNAYFWLQTWGPCPVRCHSVANLIGRAVGATTGTSARFSALNSTKNTSAVSALYTWTQISNVISGLGVAMVVGVSGEYRMVFLKISN